MYMKSYSNFGSDGRTMSEYLKSTFFIMLLSVFWTFVLPQMTQTVYAAPTHYNIYVGSEEITSENADNITGPNISVGEGGYVRYDHSTKTLTLKNATITGFYGVFQDYPYSIYDGISGVLTINLVGTNSINTPIPNCIGIGASSGLNLRGSGELTINAEGNAIKTSPSGVSIDGPSNITIVSNNEHGIYAGQAIVIKDCENMNISAPNGYGLLSQNGNISIEGTTKLISSSMYGFSAVTISIESTSLVESNTPIAGLKAITFNSNGGSGTMSPQYVTPNVASKLAKNVYTKTDKVFDKWTINQDGTGTSYADKANITITDDQTLYAQWADPHSPTPSSGSKKTDDSNSEDRPAPSKNNNIKVPDGCDQLRQSLSNAIAAASASGKPQTVYWSKGTSLPYDVMQTLHDHANITLVFSYTYLGNDFTVTIPGSAVIANPSIPWYGPVYLYALYGGAKAPALTTTTASTGSYKVKPGDTLSAIARRLKTTVKHLKEVNNIKNIDRIKPGMVLKY